MKKILVLALIVGLFVSCSSSKKDESDSIEKMPGGILPMGFVDSNDYRNKDEIETEKAKLIIAAIQNKDFETLQSLFQPSVVESAQTLYDDALALFDYIDIDMYEIIRIRISESASFGDGEGIVSWNVFVELKADGIYYSLYFIDARKNYAYTNDVGIKSLIFIKKEDYSKYNFTFLNMESGIFNPARYESANASPL